MISVEDKIQSLISPTREKIREFTWRNFEAYSLWLAQTYYFVRYSTRLLALASGRLPLELSSMHLRFNDHLKEERSHDLLLLKDLAVFKQDISRYPELPETAVFYQSQFYWIEHQDPVAFLGYILALECLASLEGPWIYEQVTGTHGTSGAMFLKVHAHDDPDHVTKAVKQVASLPQNAQELVFKNLQQSASLYGLILGAVEIKAVINHGVARGEHKIQGSRAA